jgi:hypothetical protein
MRIQFNLSPNNKTINYSISQIIFADETQGKIPSISLLMQNTQNDQVRNRLRNKIAACKRLLESDAMPSTNFIIDDSDPNRLELKGNLVNILEILQKIELLDEETIGKFKETKLPNDSSEDNLGSFIEKSKTFELDNSKATTKELKSEKLLSTFLNRDISSIAKQINQLGELELKLLVKSLATSTINIMSTAIADNNSEISQLTHK